MTTTYPSRAKSSRSGFSLVEILVVTVIIAILAAVIFPVAGKMIKKGKLEKNREIAVGLERAIDDFYTEYGYLPIAGESEEKLSRAEQIELLEELAGFSTDRNTNEKNFLSAIPAAKGKRSGLIYGTNDSIKGLADSFGGSFEIILDASYDEQIDEPNEFGNDVIKGRRSLIWCYGEEKEDESAIITNWQ